MAQEYKTKFYNVTNDDKFTKELNEMAKEGWTIVQCDFIKAVNTGFLSFNEPGLIYVVIFKREYNLVPTQVSPTKLKNRFQKF